MKTVTGIAISNIKSNKSRSILISISIFLTTFLLTILALSANGTVKYSSKNAGLIFGEYHASYVRVSEEQLKSIETRAEFYDIGKMETFAAVELPSAAANITYMDETVRAVSHFKLSEGKIPAAENDIAAPAEFFHALGYNDVKLGDSVVIPYRINGEGKILDKDFVISGFAQTSEVSNTKKIYTVFASREFFEKTIPVQERSYTICFKVLGEKKLNFDEMKAKIISLAEEVGIADKNVMINAEYLMWATDPGTETILFSIGTGILIILFSMLVIYNIFYVGIIQKIQEYGKLRAIGTTRKQLKAIILNEGMLLSIGSISLGILFGYLGTEIFFQTILLKYLADNGSRATAKITLFNLPIIILVIIISVLTVYFALLKPMRIASKVSAIEAIQYQETGKKVKKRKGYAELNLFRLTMANLARNKKRTVSTILTMGLSCVLFVVVANVAGSMNPAYAAREQIEKGDYYIYLDGASKDETYPENNLNQVQQQGLMDEDFIEEVRNADGVTNVETRKLIRAEITSDSIDKNEKFCFIEVLSKKEFNNKLKYYKRGNMDYDLAVSENGVIYCWDYWLDSLGYRIGETYQFSLYDGNKQVPFNAVLQGSCNSADVSFYMTEDTFKSLGITGDLTSEMWITSEKGKEAKVKSELENLTSQSKFYEMKSYADEFKLANFAIRMLRGPAYALLTLLGIIGFMNMANTLITGIITRKRELGILQAIGLTNKQLNRMLQMEGLVFTIGTLLISLSIGNILGYLAFLKCKNAGWIGINEYHFPLIELSLMVVVLLVFQMILSLYMSCNMQKDSLTERVRYTL